MKKWMLALSLLLAAVLLSGCALPSVLYALSAREKNGPVVTEPEMAVSGEYYYEDMEPVDGLAMIPAFEAPLNFNTEEYASIDENGFRSTATSPLSTFSADVDTASYGNLRRMLKNGWNPDEIPTGAVRVEEMLNYFRYDDPAPTGDDRFAVTAQISACPWNAGHQLLYLGVRAADAPATAQEGSNLVFLVDVSGSMASEDKIDLVKEALTMLLDELGENDTLSIVTYAAGEELIIDGASPVRDRAALIAAIDGLSASGSTNGERGLAMAYETAQRHFRRNGNNRVILCSDGDLNVGITSESDLHDFVSEKKETGVYLSVLGFGEGNYKDTKMETLADDGNGNYYYIDSRLEARKVLVEELTQTLYAVADDVKFQVEFNPAKVSAYRQIGYENRALEDADFTDDKKDAGEVGAGSHVTVLYELVPAAEGDDSGLRYQTRTLTDAALGGEWLTVSVRYKEPGGTQSRLQEVAVGDQDVTDAPGDSFRFAAAVAEFGMILSGSEYAGTATYDGVLEMLKDGLLTDEYREEFFSLVELSRRAQWLSE